jgi:hypothetical protein
MSNGFNLASRILAHFVGNGEVVETVILNLNNLNKINVLAAEKQEQFPLQKERPIYTAESCRGLSAVTLPFRQPFSRPPVLAYPRYAVGGLTIAEGQGKPQFLQIVIPAFQQLVYQEGVAGRD